MTNEVFLFNIFALCNDKNKFVYEVTNIFGNKLTIEELEYWTVFSIIISAKMSNVDIKGLTFEEAVERISLERVKRKEKLRGKRKGVG